MSVGQQIVSLRKQQGFTQAALAKAAKLSPSAIAMYETDRRTPDTRSLNKLAAALGVSATELSVEAAPSTADISNSRAASAAEAGGETVQSKNDAQSLVTAANQSESGTDRLSDGTTQLTLTLEEARVILFLRMHPQAMSFIQTYITAGSQRRSQLEKAWRLINEFQ